MCVSERAAVFVLIVYSSSVDLKAFRMTGFDETDGHFHTTANLDQVHGKDNAYFSEKF